MAAGNFEPLRDLLSIQNQLNALFEGAAARQRSASDDASTALNVAEWVPPADAYETEAEFLIAMDVPGIDRSKLELTLDDEALEVRGERAAPGMTAHRTERPAGRFIRRFVVPSQADKDGIRAEYSAGVLWLRMQKRKAAGGCKVQVKIN